MTRVEHWGTSVVENFGDRVYTIAADYNFG